MYSFKTVSLTLLTIYAVFAATYAKAQGQGPPSESDKATLVQADQARKSRQYDAALVLLQPLADRNVSHAISMICDILVLNVHTEQSLRRALPLLRELKESPQVDDEFGIIYSGHYAKSLENEGLAAFYFKKSADAGNMYGQAQLGRAYYLGYGVLKDRKEAMRWFQSAANQGDAASEGMLSFAYATGDGVEKDAALALRWANKAAAQNDDTGFEVLGALYMDGFGVKKDKAKGINFLRRSADLGNEDAKKILSTVDETRQKPKGAAKIAVKKSGMPLTTGTGCGFRVQWNLAGVAICLARTSNPNSFYYQKPDLCRADALNCRNADKDPGYRR